MKLFYNLVQSLAYSETYSKKARKTHMSRDMRFQTMWYVRPAQAQTSLRIHAVWSEPLLVALIFYKY